MPSPVTGLLTMLARRLGNMPSRSRICPIRSALMPIVLRRSGNISKSISTMTSRYPHVADAANRHVLESTGLETSSPLTFSFV